MDPEKIPLNHIAIELHRSINKQYSVGYDFLDELHADCLSYHQLIDIADINKRAQFSLPENSYPAYLKVMRQLCERNIFFKATVIYFRSLIKEKLTTSTCATLGICEKTTNITETFIDQTPLFFKKAIFSDVIWHSPCFNIPYTIELWHSSAILDCDICPHTHVAVVTDANGYITTWDLNSRKVLYSLHKKIKQIAFAKKGSWIIGRDDKEITIWKNPSFDIVYKILHYTLNYTPINNFVVTKKDHASEILSIYHSHQHKGHLVSLWKLSNKKAFHKTTESIGTLPSVKKENLNVGQYTAHMPWLTQETMKLYVKKKHSPLRICELAIKNTTNAADYHQLKTTHTYSLLTKHEKELIHNIVSTLN